MIAPRIVKIVRDREAGRAQARAEIAADHWTPETARAYVRELGASFGKGDAFAAAFDHEIAALAARGTERAA